MDFHTLVFFYFSRTSAGKLKSYGFWELRSHCFSAKNRSYSLPADFKLSGNLDLGLFSQISVGKLRSYVFWKFRSYSGTANFPWETSDLTLPGNLDLLPF